MIEPLQYCQERGLRILSVDGFKFFYNTLANYPGNYLEIGVFEGFILRELARKYPDKTIYGIDPFIEDGNTTGHGGYQKGERTLNQRDKTYENIKGIPNITFFEETSREFAKRSDDELEKMNVSCVLLDGDHSFEDTMNDLELCNRLIAGRGVIYVDDLGMPSVNLAVEEFLVRNRHRIAYQDDKIFFIK